MSDKVFNKGSNPVGVGSHVLPARRETEVELTDDQRRYVASHPRLLLAEDEDTGQQGAGQEPPPEDTGETSEDE